MGIEEGRIRMEWIAASEGDKVQRVMNEMTEAVRRLGPLHLEPLKYQMVEEFAAQQQAAGLVQGGAR
jgi:F420-non-reducing hydrogenase iron-sulfur subunit